MVTTIHAGTPSIWLRVTGVALVWIRVFVIKASKAAEPLNLTVTVANKGGRRKQLRYTPSDVAEGDESPYKHG